MGTVVGAEEISTSNDRPDSAVGRRRGPIGERDRNGAERRSVAAPQLELDAGGGCEDDIIADASEARRPGVPWSRHQIGDLHSAARRAVGPPELDARGRPAPANRRSPSGRVAMLRSLPKVFWEQETGATNCVPASVPSLRQRPLPAGELTLQR